MHLPHKWSEWIEFPSKENHCIFVDGIAICFVESVRYCLECPEAEYKVTQERKVVKAI